MMRLTQRLMAVVFLVTLLAAACGGSDDAEPTAGNDAEDSATPDDAAKAAATNTDDGDSADADSGPCPAQGFVGSISRLANPDAGHADAAFETGDVWQEGVIGTRLADGAHYTLYVADHEYVGDPRDFDTITADAGGAVATLSFAVFDGFTAGQPFAVDDEGTLIFVIVDAGGGAQSFAGDATGTVTPIGWTDDVVCFDINFSDEFQTVTGQVSAPIVAGF